ncbi:MAG: TraX family protein [Lachnospiraceae bacterium]|nr:TraX family protein [Lachnospiraceae bacterium]
MKEKWSIDESTLKIIACVSMLIDHIGAAIILPMIQAGRMPEVPLIWGNYNLWSFVYAGMRLVGRLAFPIYLMLLIEGFEHTHHLKRYTTRLLIFAFISEIPFDLAIYRSAISWQRQNVFFSLFIGLLMMTGFRYVMTHFKDYFAVLLMDGMILAVGMAVAWFIRCDYGMFGIAALAVMYALRIDKREALFGSIIVLTIHASNEVAALATIPLAHFYNGERGKSWKYVFYVFYPVHLLLLYLIYRGML